MRTCPSSRTHLEPVVPHDVYRDPGTVRERRQLAVVRVHTVREVVSVGIGDDVLGRDVLTVTVEGVQFLGLGVQNLVLSDLVVGWRRWQKCGQIAI